jgi:hypothetical protein
MAAALDSMLAALAVTFGDRGNDIMESAVHVAVAMFQMASAPMMGADGWIAHVLVSPAWILMAACRPQGTQYSHNFFQLQRMQPLDADYHDVEPSRGVLYHADETWFRKRARSQGCEDSPHT